jgi:hypothetical protein
MSDYDDVMKPTLRVVRATASEVWQGTNELRHLVHRSRVTGNVTHWRVQRCWVRPSDGAKEWRDLPTETAYDV